MKVKYCKNCPAHEYVEEISCSFCNFLDVRQQRLGWINHSLDVVPPPICPLRQGKIEVELEE